MTARDRRDVAAWLEHRGVAPTPLTVDAIIALFRGLEGGDGNVLPGASVSA